MCHFLVTIFIELIKHYPPHNPPIRTSFSQMNAIREGLGGDTIVSFFPTQAYLSRPSFLELQMAESLLGNFKSAVVFAVASDRRDLVKMILDGLVALLEVRQAFSTDAPGTVAENFIGLRRVQQRKFFSLRLITLIESVLLPMAGEYGKRFKTLIDPHYRALKTLTGILYISGLSDYASPLQFLGGVRIARNSDATKNSNGRVSKIINATVWGLIYAIQLGQWYFSHEDSLQRKKFTPSSLPPPPKKSAAGLPADPTVCPICLRQRSNPAVVVATGVVYCYACIWPKIDSVGIPIDAPDKSKFIRRLAVL
jgi:hypothetical protein